MEGRGTARARDGEWRRSRDRWLALGLLLEVKCRVGVWNAAPTDAAFAICELVRDGEEELSPAHFARHAGSGRDGDDMMHKKRGRRKGA